MKWFKPAPGRALHDPTTGDLLGNDGFEVDETAPFWVARIAAGDVVETTEDAVMAERAEYAKGPPEDRQ